MAIAAIALVASGCVAADADARGRSSYSKKTKARKARGLRGISFPRGTTEGACPCNGGDVCVGPRGGRYCVTSGGNKRYGV